MANFKKQFGLVKHETSQNKIQERLPDAIVHLTVSWK